MKYANTGSQLVQYLMLKDSNLTWTDALKPYYVNGRGLLRCSGIQIYPTYSIQSNDGELSLIDDENMCAYTDDCYLYLNMVKFTANAVHSDLDPAWSNEFDMGGSGYYWRRIYCDTIYRNSTASTSSDRKLKQNIKPLTEAFESFLMGLTPVSFAYKNGHRTHMGFEAQGVKDVALSTVGDLALFRASVIGDDNAPYSADIPDEKLRWYLSYEELIAPMVAMLQHQQRRIERLETALGTITPTQL